MPVSCVKSALNRLARFSELTFDKRYNFDQIGTGQLSIGSTDFRIIWRDPYALFDVIKAGPYASTSIGYA